MQAKVRATIKLHYAIKYQIFNKNFEVAYSITFIDLTKIIRIWTFEKANG